MLELRGFTSPPRAFLLFWGYLRVWGGFGGVWGVPTPLLALGCDRGGLNWLKSPQKAKKLGGKVVFWGLNWLKCPQNAEKLEGKLGLWG